MGDLVMVLKTPTPDPEELASTSNETSVTQYGITWTFDQAYPVGQYVTGDYFVIGPVTISSVSPAWDGTGNGSMVNPVAGSSHGHDTRAPGYSAGSRQAFPATISVGSSICSAVSHSTEDQPQLDDVAVLTVVSSAPYADSFRPPAIGTDKTSKWRLSTVTANIASIPALDETANTPSDLSTYLADTARPWPLWGFNYQSSYLHANNNMPSYYHREIGRFLSQVSVLCLTDLADTEDRAELIRNFVQVGLDYYGMALSGEGTTAYWEWPVLFAGIMLGDEDIYNIYVENRCQHTIDGEGPREHAHLYAIADRSSTVVSEIVPAGYTWTGKTVGWRQSTLQSNCYEQEHLHPTEWAAVTESEECPSSLSTRETYRVINSPGLVGMALCAAIMDKESLHLEPELFFPYVDRWMDEDLSDGANDVYGDEPKYTNDASEYGSSTSTFVNEFFAANWPGV